MAGAPLVERMALSIGGLDRAELRSALSAAGILLNAHAETLLAHAVFDTPSPRRITVTERAVADLALQRDATLQRVFRAAQEQGLALCPPETGPYLRLALRDQPDAPDSVLSAGRSPSGALKVATPLLSDDDEYPKGFYLRVVDGQSWLRGYRCDGEYVFSPADRFVFRLPEPRGES